MTALRRISVLVHRLRADERGTMSLLVLVVAGGILVIIGMAYDGGGQYDDAQRATFLAQEAARAGAQQIDVSRFMATGQASMNAGLAKAAARNYLAAIYDMSISDVHVEVSGRGDAIQVWFTVNRNVVFLTGPGWGIDKAYGNAVVVLKQGVTDAGG